MTMLHIFKQLVKEYGFDPSIRIHKGHGICQYNPATDTIDIYLAGRNYAEQVFSLLHEYRHSIQRNTLMFNLIGLKPSDLPNDSTYLDLPWEKDANDWAVAKGVEMGFFLPGYLPRWLKNPETLDGGWR